VRFKLPIGILSQHLQHRIHCSKNQKTKKTDNIVTGMHQMATHQHFPESGTFFFQSDKIFNRAEQTKYLFHSIFASSKSMKSLLKYTKNTHILYTQRDAARKRLPTRSIFRYFRTQTKTCVSSFFIKISENRFPQNMHKTRRQSKKNIYT